MKAFFDLFCNLDWVGGVVPGWPSWFHSMSCDSWELQQAVYMTGKLEDTARMAKNVWSHAEVGCAAVSEARLSSCLFSVPLRVMFCISQL